MNYSNQSPENDMHAACRNADHRLLRPTKWVASLILAYDSADLVALCKVMSLVMFLVFLSMRLDLRGSFGFFCRGILSLRSIVFNSPFEVMLFERSFGLTRSLLILYVHEHDRLGFGMLTVEKQL